MDNIIPISKFSKTKILGKALLKIGTKKTQGYVKQTFSSKKLKDKQVEHTNEEIAQIIFDALGELKGISVKIAQQIALGMPFLPKAYLEKISHSFNAIPPINKALIRKIIKTELDKYPNEIFDTFDAEAFAAASLGQVHLATYENNTFAVKVQYPGIKKSIENDMTLIHFGLKRFAKGENVDHIITEIEERLYEEVDYLLEAKNSKFFSENLNIENILIPKVYEEFSTSRVLCTSFFKGMSFETYLASNPSVKEKNHYAQLIFESFFITLYKLQQIHADPNPGNFLFMEDGKLGMIDFGCVKKVDKSFLVSYNSLHLNLLNDVPDEVLVEQYVKLGMIVEDTPEKMLLFYTEVIKPLDRLYLEPLLEDSYDFLVHNDFSKRGFESVFKVQQKQFNSVHQVNEKYIFLNRTLLGYYSMFEKMGAKINTSFVRELILTFEGEDNG